MASVTPEPCGQWIMMFFDEEYGFEYEGQCQLPKGHDGDHFDGLSWFTIDRYGLGTFTDGQHG